MPQTREEELDYLSLMARSRALESAHGLETLRLAILSDAATQQLVLLLRILFRDRGVDCEFYEGAFDSIELEAHDSASGLYKFQLDGIILLHAVQAFCDRYYKRRGTGTEFLERESARLDRILDAIRAHSSASILLSNFAMPYERFFGNYDHKVPEALYSIVSEMNRRFVRCAVGRKGVTINDVEAVASWRGRRYWFDDRFWCISKAFCSFDQLPYVARNIVDIVISGRGRSVKCIAFDLDNTVWGGVIGDDGPEGISVGPHGDGEPFYRFQRYLLELKKRGLLLAVCSKNDFENAVLPFRNHPEMPIRETDIAAFVANWSDKAENLRAIERGLNIGLQSIVFIDDNPFERNLVRDLLPEVIVPEMPEDPADYVQALSVLNLFETTSFSVEDTRRTELYAAEGRRQTAVAHFAGVDEYLASLDMKLKIARFDDAHLTRIAQLLQRSNQFNLTTKRRNEGECRNIMNDSSHVPLYAELSDRFGEHGLISVIIVDLMAGTAAITDWLMSCRVLSRGVEQELMNYVFEVARESGVATVAGRYVRSAKNGMVSDFYPRFGFQLASESPDGEILWTLGVDDYKPRATHLQRIY